MLVLIDELAKLQVSSVGVDPSPATAEDIVGVRFGDEASVAWA